MEDSTKQRLVNMTLVAAVLVAGAIGWAAVRRAMHSDPPPPVPVIAAVPVPEAPQVRPVPAPVMPAPVAQAPVVPVAPPQAVVTPREAPVRSVPTPAMPAGPIAEPDARVALATVGRDPAAERVWVQAINDTSNLSAGDRKNLIEDLNETGFDDPRNLTADDLPLIKARLDLIDSLYVDAADDTNAAAFDEAYKDLLNMRARLTGQ